MIDATRRRFPIDASRPADELVAGILRAALALPFGHSRRWAVAVPGPFEYRTGVGRYESVGKFDALNGVDLGAALRTRLGRHCDSVAFLNDADAFGMGESAAGAGRPFDRFCCLTLGTGVGSGWISAGAPSDGGIAGGEVHLLEYEGHRIEERMSRRAIRGEYALRMRYAAAGPLDLPDVREIAGRARAGDGVAADVLDEAFSFLGRALREPLRRFGAEAVVIGGSISGSWDLLLPSFRRGLDLDALAVVRAELDQDAPLIGAAVMTAPA